MAGLQTLMPGVAAECLRSQGWGKAWRLTKKWQSLETRDRRLRGERNIPGWGGGQDAQLLESWGQGRASETSRPGLKVFQ